MWLSRAGVDDRSSVTTFFTFGTQITPQIMSLQSGVPLAQLDVCTHRSMLPLSLPRLEFWEGRPFRQTVS